MSDITEPKNRFDLRWYDEVICLRKENAALRADIERFTGHGLLDCHAICDQRDAAVQRAEKAEADNAALRTAISDFVANVRTRNIAGAGEWHTATDASFRVLRAALGPANQSANCTLVAFDGAERTVTLQFEQAPESCIGEKWVATRAEP